jgi:hypothetical protein
LEISLTADLETLAAIGEFVGGIAVLATLGYLAYQTSPTLRLLAQPAEQQAASMLKANIDGLNHMWAQIAADPSLAELFHQAKAGQVISAPADQERIESFAMMYMLNLENLLLQNQKTPFFEHVDEALEKAIEHHVVQLLATPTLLAWWERERIGFGPEFRAAVDHILASR